MHRIDTPTRAVDLFGSGKDGFRDGQPPGTSSTGLNASFFNAVQEELANAVNGFALDASVRTLLAATMLRPSVANWSAQTAAGSYSGSFLAACAGTAPTGTSTAAGRVVLAGGSGEIQTCDHGATAGYDGETWTARTAAGGPFAGNFYAALAVSIGSIDYLLFGDGGEIQSSTNNGTTWAQQAAAGSDTFRCAAYDSASDIVIAAGANGTIEKATDGTDWSDVAPAGSYVGTWRGACYHGGVWLLVGEGGEIQRSTDGGDTWAQVVTGDPQDFLHVIHDGYQFVVLDGNGAVRYSDDGTSWATNALPAALSYTGPLVATPLATVALTVGNVLMLAKNAASGGTTGFNEAAVRSPGLRDVNVAAVAAGGRIYAAGGSGAIYATPWF